jgi:hypothetical protein
MTSVFMIFEITQDYEILVPLMVANMLSFLISKRYQPLPVYDALLMQDNIHIAHHVPGLNVHGRTARELMTPGATEAATAPDVHVHPDHSIDVVLERLSHSDGSLLVVSRADARHVEGVITLASIGASLRGSSARRD